MKRNGKKVISLSLAFLLLLSAPGALAAESGLPEASRQETESSSSGLPEESAVSGPESSAVSQEPVGPSGAPGGESEEPSESSSEEPEESSSLESGPESSEEEPDAKENEAETFDANPLLVTGGHKTYMSGTGNGYFQPNKAMNRAEAATMLYNLLAAKPAVSSSSFSDVSTKDWFYTAVNSLAKAGVLTGYKDGTFLPKKTITRAEFITALSKCFSLSSGTVSFTDVTEDHWAYDKIASAVAKGWIAGDPDGKFRPNDSLKRCEAVKIMNIALDRMNEGFAADKGTQKFKDVPKSHWAYEHITEAATPDETAPGPDGPDDPEPGDFKVGQSVRVTASSGLNLRKEPVDGAVITTLTFGTVLTVTDISKMPWLQVKTSSGTAGFVSSEYVEVYVPGQASGASLSTSSISLHQYQSARVDASVSSGLNAMSWSSSDPGVAVVGYTVPYGGNKEQGAIIYGKKPGTATLTFSDSAGKTKATCKVTVTAAEAVRFAYSDQNIVPYGASFNLMAITDTSRSAVKFEIVSGPAKGAYTTTKYETVSQKSSHGLPANTVRVFSHNIKFSAAGTYTLRATSQNSGGYSSDYYEFTVMVSASSSSDPAVTTYNARRSSTEIIKVLANFEGLWNEVKDDTIAAKNPTVGHGYVVPVNSAFYNTLTDEEAFALLVEKVNKGGYASAVERFRSNNNLKMSQAQFDALVSFVYNLGSGVLTTEYDTFKVMLNAVVPPSGMSESNPVSGTLNVVTANIFKDTSIDSDVVVTVDNGKTVSVIGSKVFSSARQQEVWYKVKYNSKTGWMPAGYISLSASNLTHDLAYADSTVLANNFLQWNKAGSTIYAGLVWRRMAEAKIFFFENYAEAYHSHRDYEYNTYGFNFPQGCERYDKRR